MPLTRHTVQSRDRCELIDITDIVQAAVDAAAVKEGLAVVYVPHTTAAVTINENADPDVQHDLLAKLQALIPKEEGFYRHGEGNSDSHLKASLVGSSVTILISGGSLVLGRWQGVYFCEFDGPRRREVLIKTMPE